MPQSEYFQGHGEEVKRSIKKAHPNYSAKRVNAEFYATANKQGAVPPDLKAVRKRLAAKGAAKED